MLEHAIRLDLVKRCLEQALFLKLVVVIISDRGELLSFLIEELEVSGALVLHVLCLFGLVGPLILVTPFFVLFFFVVVIRIFEVVLLLGLFAVCRRLVRFLSEDC